MIRVYGQIQMAKQMPANIQLINSAFDSEMVVFLYSGSDLTLTKNQTIALF
jgi:hypothetical protein